MESTMSLRFTLDPPLASTSSWPTRPASRLRAQAIVTRAAFAKLEAALKEQAKEAVFGLAPRPVRPTTDIDRGSPGDPLPGETLQEWSARANVGGYVQYPKALSAMLLLLALTITSPVMATPLLPIIEPAPSQTTPVQTLDLSNYHKIFHDNFIDLHTIADAPGLTLGPGNLWVTKGWFWFSNFGDKSTNFAAGGPDGPGLHIYAHKVGPKTWDWRGGIISTCPNKTALGTYPGWRFTTGYVEFEAKLPVSNGTPTTGDGIWPGLWTDSYGTNLATQGGTELDVLEMYGAAPYDGYWETFHYTEPSPGGSVATYITNPLNVDMSAGFHRYGVMVEDPAFVTPPAVPMVIGYFDGYEVWRQPERPEFRVPKCLLVDYAIGQFLPTGVIEGSHLDVHYVKVYVHN
jgi:hypothetical protein